MTIMKHKKKVTLAAAIIFVFTLFLAGCASTQGTVNSTSAGTETPPAVSSTASSNIPASPEQLKSILTKYTTDRIAFFQSFTIGGNQNAAFALAGTDVWYITASGAQRLKSDIEFPPDNEFEMPVIWTVDGTTIFKCENIPGGSSTESYAWYVKDGKPVELPYTGGSLSYIGSGQFTTIGEGFDTSFVDGLGVGHTYKLYYLYWANDGLKEYGGLKITTQQLIKVNGAQAIIDAITKSGHTIDDIYYRANNIININYHTGDKQNGDFGNITLVYKNNTVIPQLAYIGGPGNSKTEDFNGNNLRDFLNDGIYQAARFPAIAAYPDKFPMN